MADLSDKGGPDVKELVKEWMRIKETMADLILAWGALDNHLAEIVFATLGGMNRVTSAIYFSLSSMDGRMDMASAAVKALYRETPAWGPMQDVWRYIQNKYGRLKKTRNKVAHGVISGSNIHGKSYTRLTAPLWDFAHFYEAVVTNQAPGLGSNEIKVSEQAVWRLSNFISEVKPAVEAMHRGNVRASLEILAALKARLPNRDAPDTQTPPEPGTPPQSSGQEGQA